MKITTNWKKFKSIVTDFIDEADDLLYYERENLNENDCKVLQKKIAKWIKSCQKYLQNSFDSTHNEYAQSFAGAKAYNSYLKNLNDNVLEKLNSALDELNTKKKTLQYYLELLSVSDAIIQPNFIDLEIRAMYTQNEIKDLILDKLHHLYNHNYYPIHEIIKGNGIRTGKDTVNEILEELETKGFIRIINSRKLLVQLSLKGKELVEGKRSFDVVQSHQTIEQEAQKVELSPKNTLRILKAETIYHYYERQLAS